MSMSDKKTTVQGVLHRLDDYYRKKRKAILDRLAFRNRKQGENETFDRFRIALTELAEDAEICMHCRDDQIVTQIIAGTKDAQARTNILEMDG